MGGADDAFEFGFNVWGDVEPVFCVYAESIHGGGFSYRDCHSFVNSKLTADLQRVWNTWH